MRIGWSHFFIPQSTCIQVVKKEVASWDSNPSFGWFIAVIIVIVPTIFMLHDTDMNGFIAMILMLYDVHATNDFIVMIQSMILFYAMIQECP